MLGEKVGQYQVTGKLGEGGMGTVYLAQHTLIGRPAAIKVLKAEYSHRPEVVERFFNEARAASAIRHPGIVEIYDFGYHVDDSAYIVMERLEGESLENRLRRLGRLPVDRALNLVRQVASGLAAAQDKEIIHRDLKPDNIFVVPDPDIPGGERTKILDFGIAKLAVQGGPGSYKTSTGTVMGTPAYMAPEQCKGAGHVDRRADLYALGCILFEMLCGQPPFVAEGGGEVMAQHIYATPPSPLAFDPTIPAQVDALIQRLLAKDPDQRYQGAREVIAAIDSAAGNLSSVPIHARGAQAGTAPGAQAPGVAAATPAVKTTLGSAVGPIVPSESRRSKAAYLAPALAALVLAGGGVIFALTRGGADTRDRDGDSGSSPAALEPSAGAERSARPFRAAPVAIDSGSTARATPGIDAAIQGRDEEPASHGEIELTIESDPSGADVYQQPLGVRVGSTPYQTKRPAAQGEMVYVLKKAGYRTRELVVPADRSSNLTVTLQRRATASKPPEERPGAKPGAPAPPPATDGAGTRTPVQPADSGGDEPEPGRSLNPFEKKPKKPKKDQGRSLNPFEK